MSDYDSGSGMAFSAIAHRYAANSFILPPYDLQTLAEVERRLRTGQYRDRNIVLEHLACLDGIKKRISVAASVERDSLLLKENETKRQHIRQLAEQLEQLLRTLPRLRLYRNV